MLEFLWGCMVLSLKAGIGAILWTVGFWIIIGIFALFIGGIASMFK